MASPVAPGTTGADDGRRGKGPRPGSTAVRTIEVETPEQVVLGFELADLGSRFVALLVDGVILLVLLAGLAAVFFWLDRAMESSLGILGWGMAVLVLVVFLVAWGYFVWFEGFRQGQTPGKRRVGIRVVHDGGHPLTLRGAAIRNLVRAVDIQPGITCLVGGTSMMLHPRTKRLGDLAAGTLVVRDRGQGRLPEESWAEEPVSGPPRLSDAELEALDRFALRQADLEAGARERLARHLEELVGRERLPSDSGETATRRLLHLHGDEMGRRSGGARRHGSRQAARLWREHHPLWRELEALVDVARRRGLEALAEEDVSRFAALYRALTADLARMRTYGGSGELIYALERLATSAHNLLYRPSQRSWSSLKGWLAAGFPRLVRRRWKAVAVAALALFGPAVGTWTVVVRDPGVARELLPAAMVARAETAPERLAAGQGYVDVPEVFMPVMSSSIIANNVQVTFLAFAGGILAGVGTLLLLAFNGIHLGAVAGLYHVNGAGVLLWTFVAAHGGLELGAICIAGGAGLWMGSALILPGRATRAHALTTRARDAVSLLAGTTLLLVVAGLLEGFLSPAAVPSGLKLGVATVVGLGGLAYLLGAGRKGPTAPPEAPEGTTPDLSLTSPTLPGRPSRP